MSNEIKIHKYFDQDPANWSILGFLNECELEPFETKIDSYIKGLKKIVNCEQDNKKKSAQVLLDNYQKASTNLLFISRRKWRDVDLLGRRSFKAFCRATKLVLAHQ